MVSYILLKTIRIHFGETQTKIRTMGKILHVRVTQHLCGKNILQNYTITPQRTGNDCPYGLISLGKKLSWESEMRKKKRTHKSIKILKFLLISLRITFGCWLQHKSVFYSLNLITTTLNLMARQGVGFYLKQYLTVGNVIFHEIFAFSSILFPSLDLWEITCEQYTS